MFQLYNVAKEIQCLKENSEALEWFRGRWVNEQYYVTKHIVKEMHDGRLILASRHFSPSA